MDSVPALDADAGPFFIGCAQEDGTHTGNQLARDLRHGRFVKLRRGIYLPAETWLEAYPSERLSLAVAATSAQLGSPVFCRETALHVQRLPLLRLPDSVQVRAETRHHVRRLPQPAMTGRLRAEEFSAAAQQHAFWPADRTRGAVFRGFGTHHVSPSDLPGEVSRQDADVEGVSVQTEPLDVALPDTVPRMPFEDAVVVLDAALRGAPGRPPVPRAALHDGAAALRWSKRRRHLWEAALSFADPASESPGESFARVLFARMGFAPPQLQAGVHVDGRTYRVDFLWAGAGVVGEFDGWMKYQEEGRATLREEKIREDALRSTGRRFLRCYWEDLHAPRRLEQKLLRAGVPRARPTT